MAIYNNKDRFNFSLNRYGYNSYSQSNLKILPTLEDGTVTTVYRITQEEYTSLLLRLFVFRGGGGGRARDRAPISKNTRSMAPRIVQTLLCENKTGLFPNHSFSEP
jgi:hypothetical protein